MRWILSLLLTLMMLPVQAAGLTANDVKRWVESMPEIQTWMDGHADALPTPVPAASTNLASVFEQGVAQLRTAGLYRSFEGTVGRFGYRTVEQWSDHSARISMAYLATVMSKESATMSQFKAQLDQVQAAEGLPPEQKQAMVNALSSSMAMMQTMRSVPADDKQAIAPYMNELEQVLGQ